MITLMKASAGSGKTFRLAKKYISLLFDSTDDYAYRHILAVTFTNKATDEMKSRILKELYILSSTPEKSDYYADFVPSKFPNAAALQTRARKFLSNILNDYSAFSVSTIDKFFQMALKAFSREIGQFASYQVELDKNSLVSESVDRVLDSLSEDKPELLNWLKAKVLDQLKEGGRYNMDYSLKEMAKRLKSESRKRLIEQYGIDEEKTCSRETLSKTKTSLYSLLTAYENRAKEAARKVSDAFASVGVGMDATSRGFMDKTISKFLGDIPRGGMPIPSESFMNNASDYSKWFKKADQKAMAGYEGDLAPAVGEFLSVFDEKDLKVYRTAALLVGKIHDFGIARELNAAYAELLKEKNILCLDDSNTILKNIIAGSDAPFIYEKIGVRYDSFLLDEFQDTSKVQWDNFKPLIQNSEAEGNENLIVGDVKQSIYRWRGSDWDLMASQVGKDVPVTGETLDSNYRSCATLVEFNREFFKYSAEKLDEMFPVSGSDKPIADIYSDVHQQIKVKDKEAGSLDVMFVPQEDQTNYIKQEISRVRTTGALYSDIAILVRTNADGAAIAASLMDAGIPVISDDSLKVKSSIVVRRAVSLMSLANNVNDSVGGFLAKEIGLESIPQGSKSLSDMAEMLLRELKGYDPKVFDSEIQYIQAFMDAVLDFSATNGNNLAEFLSWWNDADPAIGSPAGADAVRVMTIHKSKGLEFGYVIVPYVESSDFSRHSNQWSRPDVKGTALEGVANDVYDVMLSSQSLNTLFASDYTKELHLQHIDAINTLYVALTRAAKGMTVISADQKEAKCNTFAKLLEMFLSDREMEYTKSEDSETGVLRYSRGTLYDFGSMVRKKEGLPEFWKAEYPSIPVNPIEKTEDGECTSLRLVLSSNASDFFSEDGTTGATGSFRIRGVVLHDILSRVNAPSDLKASVDQAVLDGALSQKEAEEAFGLLSKRIAAVKDMGWFPENGEAAIVNEVTLIDTDGKQHRPDRVIIKDDKVIIVDYKFASKTAEHFDQIERYASIYKAMGYQNVSAYLWYVYGGEICS
ncbi:MAG: UvrD-helicase domain-containing protein [Bacteroidales bacterium]|nr:UvrD-helicase domain-containing protein [Bacteroidales bacterium]